VTSIPAAPLAGLPRERSGIAAPADLTARREGLAAAVRSGIWQTHPAPSELRLGGVRCLRFAAPNGSRGTVLHLHGGAFRIGCPEQMGPFAAALAARCQVDVICPAYRLSPEHPFPAGLSDAWAVLTALLAQDHSPLVISGDSAGGGLAASLTAMTDRLERQPAGLVLLSPWLDLSVSNPSYAANAARDPLFSAESAQVAADLYLQGHPATDPLASPVLAAANHFPPTLINVGTGEVLLDDAVRMAARLQSAGRPVQLQRIDGMDHVAVTRGLSLPGSAETFDAVASFVDGLSG